jgi:hypothetical protein
VHEYPVAEDELAVEPVDLDLRHDGYAPEVLHAKDKHQRNLTLLRRMLDDDPDNPRWPFYAVRDGASLLAPNEIEALCRRSARLADGSTYHRDTLVSACYAFTALGRWPTVSTWCAELDRLAGGRSPDAQYFRAVMAALSGQDVPAQLQRTAALREDEAVTGASGICRSGDHLDAAAALLIERVHGAEVAAEYRELVEPWTDMFFSDSRPRRTAPVP